jgi:hypothetical protein
MPYPFYAPTNIAVLSQSNQQFGANVALGGLVGAQTLVQVAGNNATITQG